MNFAIKLLILVIFWQFCDAAEITKKLKKQVKELKTKYASIQLSMVGLNSTMNYIYPDLDFDGDRSIDVNLRHSNTKKYKKFKRKVNKIKRDWSSNSAISVSGMCDKIADYYEKICLQNNDTEAKCQTITKVLCEADRSFSNVNGRATSNQIEDLEDLVSTLLANMTKFENITASMNEFLMEMNTPTPPGDLLLVAVGTDKWTEVHDMNKTLNRTCALEVLPDYPLSSDNSGLSYPAGGLVSGRPFFCGGKSGETLRTECYTLGGANNKTWDLVANLKTARWQHAGVSFGDSLWVTGGHLEDGTVTKTTEIIHANGTVEVGTNLQKARDAHCMVLLPPGTKVMILGADNAFGNRKTVTIFDRMTNSFSSGVKMNYNRENAACTIFKSPNHENRPVVFVGGGKEQNTAEILDYSQSGATWEKVASMPSLYPYITAMPGSRAVPTPNMDGVIFIFGSNFWELTFKNSKWKMIQMTPTPNLAISRKKWPIVEYIDENLIDVTGLCA